MLTSEISVFVTYDKVECDLSWWAVILSQIMKILTLHKTTSYMLLVTVVQSSDQTTGLINLVINKFKSVNHEA